MGNKIDIEQHLMNANNAINLWSTSLNSNKKLTQDIKLAFYDALEEFSIDAGIYNQAFIITNKQNNSVDILQGDIINNNEKYRDHLPFTKYPLKVDNPLRALIDLMFECKRSSQKLNADELSNPEFFLNIPPNFSEHVVENKPEKDWIVNNSVNFLYCGLGEILFFVICWRWLMRCAQIYGLQHEINVELIDFSLKNKGADNNNFWNHDTIMNDSSESIWVEKLKEIDNKKDEKYYGYDLTYGEISKYWNDYVFLKLDSIDSTYDIENEFKKIGITNEENQEALKKYLIDIEKETDSNLTLELGAIKVLLNLIKKDLIKKNKKITVSEYLNQLHAKSRFPLIPYFYQTVLNQEAPFYEHLAIPMCISDSFEFKNANKKLRIGVLALFSIIPLSKMTILERILAIQLFYTYISRPVIDIGFYGNVYKSNIEDESYDSFIDTLNHEASKVIGILENESTVFIKNLFDINDTVQNNNNVGRIILYDTTIDISNYRIIPDFERYSFLLKYFDLWINGVYNYLQNNYSDFIQAIINDSILICLTAIDNRYRGFDFKDYASINNYKNIIESEKGIMIKKTNIDTPNINMLYNDVYIKLLFISLTNTYKHSCNSTKINITIFENGGMLIHYFMSTFPGNNNWATEINKNIKIKNSGTLSQIKKYSSKLNGELKQFSAFENDFITCFSVSLKSIQI